VSDFHIGIVAHASRADMAKGLSHAVRADFISIDQDSTMGCEGNHRAVQHHLLNLGATFSVVLEDDAEPVKGFRDQLSAALMSAPNTAGVLSFYLGRQRPPQHQGAIGRALQAANASGAHWLLGNRLLHGVAYAIRTDLLASLLEFRSRPLTPIDQHITIWARETLGRQSVAYSVPSLCNHRDMPTVIPRHPDGQPRPPGRVAWQTGRRNHWEPVSTPLLTS
jgi:hypothetical protein